MNDNVTLKGARWWKEVGWKHILAVILMLYCIFPLLYVLSASLNPGGTISGSSELFRKVSAENYATLFGTNFPRWMLQSFVVSTATAIGTVLMAASAAYAFSRFDFPAKRLINVVVVSVQAVPPITLLIPFFGLMVGLKLYNTYQGLILTYMVFTLPYAIIMLTGYFNTLPRELDEAAKGDGTSSFGALWKVLVPISVPGIVSVGIYTFMIAWNEYLFALTLTRTNNMRTVPIGIQLLMGQHSYEWNEMMAMSVLGSIPVILLFVFFQRYFIGGMTAGSVKS